MREREAVARLFTAERVDAGWFAPIFLASVSAAHVAEIVAALEETGGAFVSASVAEGAGEVVLERARVPVTVTLDGAGRIAGLWFGAPRPSGHGNAGQLAQELAAAAPEMSVIALRDGATVAAVDPDTPRAVGSAFKLVVLDAYEDAVAAGRLRRDEVVRLMGTDRSLPSGVLHALLPGTPMTLESLAGLMIAISDNTATDALMRVIGRDALNRMSPRNAPFLTTAEAFKLKASEELRARYLAASRERRVRLLDDLAHRPLPTTFGFLAEPTLAVEWFLTSRELCETIAGLLDAPAMRGALPAPVSDAGWDALAYKGGSEFGVLNHTAAGLAADGSLVCASVTANGQGPLAAERINLLFGALFEALRR